MAELEAERDVSATYFLMTRSVFYNLDSREGEATLERLRELGHRVGLHAVYPHVDLDERFDPVLAWHNPDPEYMNAPVDGLVNVMTPPWFDRDHYRSDSNQHWRSGDPTEALARARLRVAAAADPSRDLGVRGRDDARDDGVDARRGARGAAATARRRPDRPLVKAITVLLTAAGAPGTAALLRALRENGEREVRVVGTDMSERSIGRHLCDAFALVPAGDDAGFADALRALVEREGGRRRAAAVVVRPRRRSPRRARPFPGSRARLVPGDGAPLERQGRDVRAAARPRRAGARLPARLAARRRRGGGAGARLPGARRLREAGVLVRLARVPDHLGRRRPARRSC